MADCEFLSFIATAIAVISAISFVICGFVAIVENTGVVGTIANKQATYESLLYQAENNMYENDNEIGKKELANQIQEWNQDIAKGKALQRDFWVGVFTPNIYDQFELIPVDLLS